MLNIYLADLTNDFIEIDNKSIPLGIGYVGAFCKHLFKNDVNVWAFRTLKPFLEKVEQEPPSIVGFGCYDWNYNLSRKTASLIKERYPKCIIVLGGANVDSDPENNKTFLKENPYIDFLVYSDGEFPFSNIVQSMFQFQGKTDPVAIIKSMRIDGARSLFNDTLVMGKPVDIVADLSSIPSPYLTGFFDDLLENPLLMPIIQNVRGCPYQCCFCVSGSQPAKLRSFPLERVTKEIDYLRNRAKNRILRFSDDNFGILNGDLDCANYIKESYDKYNYPTGVKVYLAKKLNERTRQISNTLKELTLMNISFQSITPDVLTNIKRIPISLSEVIKNLEFARRNGIATGTELIFGLPGESLGSMREVINKVIDLRFDSISLNVLWLLRGSEVATPAMRKRYQYKGKFMLGENAITYANGLTSIESDEIAIASNSYSFEEWKIFIQELFIFEFVFNFGYAKELLYHALTFNIKVSDFFQELLENPEQYPAINQVSRIFRDKYLENLYDTEEDLLNFIKLNLDRWVRNKEDIVSLSKVRIRYKFFVKILFDDTNHTVFDEFASAITNLYKSEQRVLLKELTEHVKDLTIALIINPKVPYEDETKFVSDYNIEEWIKDGYVKPLSGYLLSESREFFLRPRNPKVIKYVINKDKEENKENCFNFFRYTNSSDRRRIVVR